MNEYVIITIAFSLVTFVIGVLLGQRRPSKNLLKLEYYRGRCDQIENKEDYWEVKP